MNVKKAIKRIAAIGTGAALMGATVLGAMAVNLADFPAPFVQDGRFNARLVIGGQAETPDVIGAVDIATMLQYEVRTPAASAGAAAEGTTVSVSGDAMRVDQTFDRLTLGQALGGVVSSLTDEDLNVLADGRFDGTDFTQTLVLEEGEVRYSEGDGFFYDDEPGWYLQFMSGDIVFEYVLEFSGGVSTNDLDNWKGETLTMLGMEYTIDEVSDVGGNVRIELLGGESSDFISSGETNTYFLGGEEYVIELVRVAIPAGTSGTPSASLRVNGELTGTVNVGDTYTLNNGVEIGIREIIGARWESERDQVEFYLGADRIVLEDGQPLERGDDTFDNVQVVIDGDVSASPYEINSIRLDVTANRENYYLAPGDSIATMFAQTDDAMFGNIDLHFLGNTQPATTEVAFRETRDNDGEEEYSMQFTTRNGRYNLAVWAENEGPRVGAHRNDAVFWVVPSSDAVTNWDSATGEINWSTGAVEEGWIELNDKFLLNTATPSPEDTTSSIFRFTRIRWNNGRFEVTLRDEASGGATREVILRNTGTDLGGDDVLYAGTIRVNGQEHTIGLAHDPSVTNPTTTVVNEKDIGLANAYHPGVIALESGTYFQFDSGLDPSTPGTEVEFDHVVPDDLTVASGEEEWEITVDGDGFSFDSAPGRVGDAFINDRFDVEYSGFGIRLEDDTEATRQRLDLRVPFRQVLPQVFVTSGSVSVAESHGEVTGDTYDITQINPGEIAVLDTEITNWQNQNVIVVGGPCVNTVAASLMGNPEVCTDGFTQGRAKIRLFDQGNNRVAMLVAGYNADDTRRGSVALSQWRRHNFQGSEVEVSGTSMTSLTVTSVN